MRNKTREAIEAAERATSRRFDSVIEAVGIVARKISVLNDHVDAIEPARLDLTQEMADDIVRKIHGPLTIGKNFSDQLRQIAEYRNWVQTFTIGHGGIGGGFRMDAEVKTNGSLQLIFTDFEGVRMWQGTFVPPDLEITG